MYDMDMSPSNVTEGGMINIDGVGKWFFNSMILFFLFIYLFVITIVHITTNCKTNV